MTRRTLARLLMAAAGAAITPVFTAGESTRSAQSPMSGAEDDKLQSELLFDLIFDKGPANAVGSLGVRRVVVPVLGGTFDGPKLKGTLAGPSGDWIVGRPDGSSVLDMRMVLQTDDGQKIYMTCRGVAYTKQGGTLYARILPMFETGAAKYSWLNNVVAVGVYRPIPAKIAYRIYQVL